jgi:hypothetical protein
MICLTSDLHHTSLGTGNQRHCDLREIQVAQRFLSLLEGAGVRATFFISGRAFAEEWPDLEPICRHPLIEVAGHNYSCFTPQIVHRFFKQVLGSYNGPAWLQRRDARRTIDIIRRRTGRTIQCWRNHMYMHGPFTERVLHECGLRLCSDGVKRSAAGPERHPSGILNFPINIIPDHEHLYHAERTPEWVAWWVRRYRWSDDFGPQSYYIRDWTDLVLEGLRHNEANGAISNLIIHPITMYLCDRFEQFRRILDFLAQHETVHLGTLGAAEDRP